MKITEVSIKNFKKFDDLELSLVDENLGESINRAVILGNNGSGKTTILQAIALPLWLAANPDRSVEYFDWIGFDPTRFSDGGIPQIHLKVTFTKEEITKTQEVARAWYDSLPLSVKESISFQLPGDETEVSLRLEGNRLTANSATAMFQFRGRYYVSGLIKTNNSYRNDFQHLPGIFWFDQFRNLASRVPDDDNDIISGRSYYEFGVARLRRYLSGWSLARQDKSYPYDYLTELELLYKKVFPSRSFIGAKPMPNRTKLTDEDFYFLLSDGRNEYDVAEMSGGEQAVFPILYEFVRQQIANSVVIIDEVDLNLHPTAAQTFVSLLPKFSNNCQFILTTHSSEVSSIISEEATIRLDGVVV